MNTNKHSFIYSILLTLLFCIPFQELRAQDTPKTLAELQTSLNASTTLTGDIAVERLATLSAAAGKLSDTDFKTIDAAIIAKMKTRTVNYWGTTGSSTTVGNVTISSNSVYIIRGTVTFTGTITVNSGYTLVVLPENASSKIISQRSSSNYYTFYTNGGTILLKGLSEAVPLVIDGQATDPAFANGEALYSYLEPNFSSITSTAIKNRRFFAYVYNRGGLRSTFTHFQNNWRTDIAINDRYRQGNAVCFRGNGNELNTSGFYGCTFKNLMNVFRNTRATAVGTDNAVFDDDFRPDGTDIKGGLLLGNCTFDGNASVCSFAGSNDSPSHTLNYGHCFVDGTKCAGGGAVGCEAGGKQHNMKIVNCTFKNNYAGWFGGAVFWNNTAKLFIENCKFEYNVGGLGGAVYVEGSCDIKGSIFQYNKAKCMNTEPYQGGNGFDGCGGAVYARCCNEGNSQANCLLNLYGTNTFENNSADLDGGALELYFDKGSWNNTSSASRKTITYAIAIGGTGETSSFTNNTAGRCGGGIAVVESPDLNGAESTWTLNAEFNFNNGLVQGNQALGTKSNDSSSCKFNEPGDGGGIYAEYMNLTIGDGFQFKGNQAKNNGGGIFSRGNATYGNITVGNAELTGNKALGAVASTITAKIKTKDGNGATHGTCGSQQGNGGAVCISGGSFTMTGGTLGTSSSPNEAVGNGGCVCVTHEGEVVLTGGNVDYNKATLNGGGFYVNGGTVEFDAGSISHNTAQNGGGLYLDAGASMTIEDGLVTYNNAVGSWSTTTAYADNNNKGVGGGIYLHAGTSNSNKTELEFTSSESIGLYYNEAENAADDIYANTSNTSLVIPEVQFMNLKGYNRFADGWYEDYANADSRYDNGFDVGGTSLNNSDSNIKRYRVAAAAGTDVHKTFINTSAPITGKYAALTMGVSDGKIQLVAEGLKAGESVIITVRRPLQAGDNPSLYGATNPKVPNFTVTVTADANGVAKTTLAGLPIGWYDLKCTPWDWAYESDGENAVIGTDTDLGDETHALTGSAGATTIDDSVGEAGDNGHLAASVVYRTATKGTFQLKTKSSPTPPRHGEGAKNNKFQTVAP